MKEYEIQWLSDRPELVEQTADLLLKTFPDYYGPEGSGDALATAKAGCNTLGLPQKCVAVDAKGQVLAICALQQTSIPTHKHLTPWLASLATDVDHRRRGIAEALVAATEDKAREMAFKEIYCATYNAIGIVERRGWQRIDETLEGETLYGIYVLKL